VHGKIDWPRDARPGNIFHAQCRSTARPRPITEQVVDRPAGHRSDHRLPIGGFGIIDGGHAPAIAKHGNAVTESIHFLQPVRHIQDRTTGRAQAGDDCHQPVDLARRKTAGRLVKRDDPRIALQCLADFHHLPLGDRQITDARLRIDIFAQPIQHRPCIRQQPAAIDKPETRWQLAQRQVFGHALIGNRMQFLMNDGNSCIECQARRGQCDIATIQHQAAGCRPFDPAEHF
jgi:hypothetical protein